MLNNELGKLGLIGKIVDGWMENEKKDVLDAKGNMKAEHTVRNAHVCQRI